MTWLLLGCPRPPEAPPPDLLASERAAASAEVTGVVVDGVWEDRGYPYALRVPEGFEVAASPEGVNPRVTVVDPATRARVEVSVHAHQPRGPRPRRGCTWDFVDAAPYRQLAFDGEVAIATCTPDDPLHARVLGYYVVHRGSAYDIETVIPPGRLADGKAAGDRVVAGLRFR